jgi:hypothetical protein
MRHKDTVAVTITLPGALYEAVQELAKKRECGNVSAVARTSLYKEVGLSPTVALKEDSAKRIEEAQARTVKYSRRNKKKDGEPPK